MADLLFDLAAQVESSGVYVVYTPILLTAYSWIGISLLRKAKCNFLRLVVLSCISDVTLCFLSNFFYRWPRNGTFHSSVYSKLTQYSGKLALGFYLLHHLSYGMIVVVLFMSFNVFCTLVYRRMYEHFWNRVFYKYVLGFLIFPICFFVNLLSAESRFRLVDSTAQYYVVTRSTMLQYVSRETGTMILGYIWATTLLLFFISLIRLFCRLCFKHATKLDANELRNSVVCFLYTLIHGLFLGYEFLTCFHTSRNDEHAVYVLGGLFPVLNDLITLTPPIFLLLVSSQIRRVVLPTRLTRRRHTIAPAPTDEPTKVNAVGDQSAATDGQKAVEVSPPVVSTRPATPASSVFVISETPSTVGADKVDYPALPYGTDWTDHLSSEKRIEMFQPAETDGTESTTQVPADPTPPDHATTTTTDQNQV